MDTQNATEIKHIEQQKGLLEDKSIITLATNG